MSHKLLLQWTTVEWYIENILNHIQYSGIFIIHHCNTREYAGFRTRIWIKKYNKIKYYCKQCLHFSWLILLLSEIKTIVPPLKSLDTKGKNKLQSKGLQSRRKVFWDYWFTIQTSLCSLCGSWIQYSKNWRCSIK